MFPTDIFDEKKASQAAAYFLFRSGGKMEMPVLKLVKLLYLAERRSFQLYSEPMIGDRVVSMPHGPVLSITYNHMNGDLESADGGWTTWMRSRVGNDIGLREGVLRSPQDDLLELSDADLEILEQTWDVFGPMDQFEIRDYTHDHCPEWRDPNGSMIPMTYGDLFNALEFSQDRQNDSLALLEEKNGIARTFKRAFS
ncbi:Panacea domain-containing protein [Duganella violaceipulchra]|uniref:Phage-associated protein n=1 Tax=Duganella violaceipulchra TaxID=2849652 RepID=A0AA41H4K2_9BURK|nr:Panacea domain-containing protein [Duganella violaceicalia]MBV6321378.1 SocA family protein [Duganella violaceicalia]MCP2009373.1 putative phage-associated protein [Duganella violaceicalia]